MMITVGAVHTAGPMVEPMKALFAEHLPEVRLFNILDESLIQSISDLHPCHSISC